MAHSTHHVSPFGVIATPNAPNAMKRMALVRFVGDFFQSFAKPYPPLMGLLPKNGWHSVLHKECATGTESKEGEH